MLQCKEEVFYLVAIHLSVHSRNAFISFRIFNGLAGSVLIMEILIDH